MILKMTFSQWMQMNRPQGYGTISVGHQDTKSGALVKAKEIRVHEVICDLCNDEIKPKDLEGRESEIFQDMDHNQALCRKCGHKPWVAEGHGRV